MLFCLFYIFQGKGQCINSLLFDIQSHGVFLPAGNQYYSGNNGGYTWQCWFKLNEPLGSQVRPLIAAVDGVVFEDLWLGFGWNGGWFDEPATSLVFKVDGPNGAAPSVPNCAYAPVGGFQIGVWYQATGVMNYMTHLSQLFVNGVLVDSQTTNVTPITRIIPTSLSLAQTTSPQVTLGGNMDEVRIWSRVLTPQEILADYTNCLSGTESFLELYYHCNDGGSLALDASPNSRNGDVIAPGTGWSAESAPLNQNCVSQATLDLGIDQHICVGDSVHFAIDTSIFSNYQWTGINLSCYSCPDPDAFPVISTEYIFSASTTSGCFATDTIEVFVSHAPFIDLGNDLTICKGESKHLSTISADPFITYQWTPVTGVSCTNCPDPLVSPMDTTTYYLVATNSQGCLAMDSITLFVRDNKPQNVALLITDATCEQGGKVTIEVTNANVGDLQYNFANQGFSHNPIYENISPNNYLLSIRFGNDGCEYDTIFTVKGDQNAVFIPNTFTPDGNEVNNTWGIKGSCLKEINCRIFNRWGEKIATLTDISEEWDGTFSGQKSPDGLYTYVIEVMYESQSTEVLTGFIVLIR